MRTGKREGKSVYGPRPSLEDMAKRLKRDGVNKISTVDLRPVLEAVRSGSYYIEAWAIRSNDVHQQISWDETVTPPVPVYQAKPGWLVYTLRRDGRIQCNGHPQAEDTLVFLSDGDSGIDEEV